MCRSSFLRFLAVNDEVCWEGDVPKRGLETVCVVDIA